MSDCNKVSAANLQYVCPYADRIEPARQSVQLFVGKGAFVAIVAEILPRHISLSRTARSLVWKVWKERFDKPRIKAYLGCGNKGSRLVLGMVTKITKVQGRHGSSYK